jgi:hypothetical protein
MHQPSSRSRLLRRCCGGVAFAALFAASAGVHAQDAGVGRIKVASGPVFIVRNQVATPAAVGDAVLELDSLRTGDDARLGVTLKDETRISLGPRSEIRISQFVYAPAEGRLAFVMGVLRGVAAYISGQIARLSPDAVRVETPDAIIGVRGTRLAIRVRGE